MMYVQCRCCAAANRFWKVRQNPLHAGDKGRIISAASLETFCACNWRCTTTESSEPCYSNATVDFIGQYKNVVWKIQRNGSPKVDKDWHVCWANAGCKRNYRKKLGRRLATAIARFISEICGHGGKILLFHNCYELVATRCFDGLRCCGGRATSLRFV